MPAIQISPDPWIAAQLGCDAYRVSIAEGCSLREIQTSLAKLRHGFYFSKIPTANIEQSQGLQQGGFYVVDVNVTFQRVGCANEQGGGDECRITLYDAKCGDVARIAEQCFVYSRFHLDPCISAESANRVKRAWVESYMTGVRGDRLWVAKFQGAPVGFLCELFTEQDGTATHVVDLVGVDARYQGRGIGRQLLHHVLGTAKDKLVRVGTQVSNVPSVRFYEKNGFRLVESLYVLHAHIGQQHIR